jgi:hypothetical protein
MPMGLWDIDCDSDMRRVVHQPMLKALVRAQLRVQRALARLPAPAWIRA